MTNLNNEIKILVIFLDWLKLREWCQGTLRRRLCWSVLWTSNHIMVQCLYSESPHGGGRGTSPHIEKLRAQKQSMPSSPLIFIFKNPAATLFH